MTASRAGLPLDTDPGWSAPPVILGYLILIGVLYYYVLPDAMRQ